MKKFNHLIEGDERMAVGEINYRRAVLPDPYRPMGPNTLGEWLWPVTVSEDFKSVGLCYIEPPDRMDP